MPRVFLYAAKTGDTPGEDREHLRNVSSVPSRITLTEIIGKAEPTRAVLEGYALEPERGAHFLTPFIYAESGSKVEGEVFELTTEQMGGLRKKFYPKDDYVEKTVTIDGQETIVFVGRPSSIRAEKRIEKLCQAEATRRRSVSPESIHYTPTYLADVSAAFEKDRILKEERAKGN